MKALTPERAEQAAEYIRSHWRYDPATGKVHGRCDKPIGTVRKDGAMHALVYLPGGVTSVLLHRAAWLLRNGSWPEFEVDHEDGDRSNNRWVNLRLATRSQNRQNLAVRTKKGGLRGATRFGAKWRAQIRVPGARSQTHLGVFETEQEAHEAYCKAKREFHPFQPVQR
jgi:HNH endonuclease